MRDPERFTVADPRFSTAQVIGPSMLSCDGAEHERHRAPFVAPFRRGEVHRRFAGPTIARARELVAALTPTGEGELRSGLAAPLAVDVVAGVLGMEGHDPAAVLCWYDAIVASVDTVTAGGAPTAAGADAVTELRAAVIAAAETDGTLLAAAAGFGTLTTDELVSNAAVLLFGGIVTAEGATAIALYHLLSHPDQLELVTADRSLLANAVEESLRFEPAAAVVDRYATADTEVGNAPIRYDDLVRVSLAAANRDPAVFPEPHRFDIARQNANQHLAFARGPHACLGIHLARLETRVAVEAVLELLPNIRLDPARTTPPEGLIFRRPEAVWAMWDPSSA